MLPDGGSIPPTSTNLKNNGPRAGPFSDSTLELNHTVNGGDGGCRFELACLSIDAVPAWRVSGLFRLTALLPAPWGKSPAALVRIEHLRNFECMSD